MMIPIFVMKSVVGGHFVPFFVKYIRLKSPSRLQRLPGRYFVLPAVGRSGEFHDEELFDEKTD
jgi:hypothetical protein